MTFKNMLRIVLTIVTFLAWVQHAAFAEELKEDVKEHYSVEQYLKTEGLGNAVASPDGRYIALEKLKSMNEAGIYDRYSVAQSIANRELWVVDLKSGTKTKINIPGAHGIWAGSWSPDGTQLVVNTFSLKDRTLKIGIWNLKKRHFTKLPGTPELSRNITYPFWIPHHVWVDNETIIYPVLPAEKKPFAINSQRQQVSHIVESSQKTWQGIEPSYSILDSGNRLLHDEGEKGQLVQYNIRTNEKSILAKGNFSNLYLSPDRKKLVALTLGPIVAPRNGQTYGFQAGGSFLRNQNLMVYLDLQNPVAPHHLTNKLDIVSPSIRWSPNSEKFAFMARDVEGTWQDDTGIYVFDTARKRLNPQNTDNIEINHKVSSLNWLENNLIIFQPLLSAREVEFSKFGKGNSPSRLWKVSSKSAPLKVNFRIKSPFTYLCQQGDKILGIAGGELWRLNSLKSFEKIETDSSVALTRFDDSYLHFNKSSNSQCPVGENALLPFVAKENGKPVHAYLDWKQKTYKVIPGPLYKVHLSVTSSQTPLLLYKTQDEGGKHFTLVTNNTEKPEKIFSVNESIQNIKIGKVQSFTYSVPGDEENQTLTGWILTPPDYQEGKRYPVISMVYPGRVFNPENFRYGDPQSNTYHLNGQLFAARGYIVLYPSLPMDTMERPLNLPKQLAEMTNAALDQLIDDGIADPNQLAIVGHSDGALTTLSILTQTDRFKSAIASAGPYNYTMAYGAFFTRNRRKSSAHHTMFGPSFLEAPRRLNASPWQAPERYIHNSPLYFADKITTPVLFLHGDLDFIPIQQAEEMFTALYRQGKKARFMRLWAEEHGINSPANLRQVWREIDRWLDETMGNDASSSEAANDNPDPEVNLAKLVEQNEANLEEEK